MVVKTRLCEEATDKGRLSWKKPNSKSENIMEEEREQSTFSCIVGKYINNYKPNQ